MKAALLTLSLAAVGCAAPAQWPTADATWAFDPPRDQFRADALLDLRYLNEKVAGESGFVRVSPEGDFLLGNGKPVRFWAVGTDVGREKPFNARPLGRKDEPSLDYHARFLAKRGVNMTRCHAFLSPKSDQPLTAMNEGDRDWIWRHVAAMKKEGIYTTISPFFALTAKPGPGWGLGADDAHGLLFFHPKLQTAYKGWLRKLFTEKNPYTGVPLSQDASVAIIQIQNEDSLFFWTVNNLKGEPRQMLQKRYGDWLAKKYGSLAAAFRSWEGQGAQSGDNVAAGLADFANIWEMTQPRQGGFAKRLEDQTRFWTEVQRGFYAEIVRYLRQDLGCKQLINASNWKTADSVRLGDVERYTYGVADVDAVNRYYGGIHKGPNEGWAIQNGDKFTSDSVLRDPLPLPVTLKQGVGRPMIITESAWVMPNAYASQGPLMVAAYQALTGVDAYYWFATGDDGFTPPQSANGYNPSQGKWLFGNPDMLGNFPAAALMYRTNALRRGAPVVVERRSLEDLMKRRTPVIAEEASFDPNRDTGDMAPTSSVKTGVSAYAYLVGPVQVEYGKDASGTQVTDLKSFLDLDKKTVRSNTGELDMNWGTGQLRINSPRAQGVSAHFQNGQAIQLADVSFASQNSYGNALAVSMDGRPLKSSGKILVQFGTQCRPTDWAERPATIELGDNRKVAGFEVVNYGKAPWRVVEARLTVTVANPGLAKATAVDPNGQAVRAVPLEKSGNGFRFAFPKDCLYVVLEGKAG